MASVSDLVFLKDEIYQGQSALYEDDMSKGHLIISSLCIQTFPVVITPL